MTESGEQSESVRSTDPGQMIEQALSEALRVSRASTVVAYWRSEISGNFFPIHAAARQVDLAIEEFIQRGADAEAALSEDFVRSIDPSSPQAIEAIRVGGTVIGAVAAYSLLETATDPRDALRCAADGLAGMVELATLYCSSRIRRSIFEVGAASVRRIADGQSPDDFLLFALDIARSVAGARAAAVVISHDGECTIREPVIEGTTRRVVTRETRGHWPPPGLGSDERMLEAFVPQRGITDALAVSLNAGSVNGGYFVVGWSERRPTHPSLEPLISALARHLSVVTAIERLRASLVGHRAKLRSARHRIEIISKLNRDLGLSVNEDDAYRLVAGLAVPALCDYCFIHRAVAPDGFVLSASGGVDAAVRADLAQRFSSHLPGEIAGGGPPLVAPQRSVLVWDVAERAAISPDGDGDLLVMLEAGVRSSITAPIYDRGDLASVITLCTSRTDLSVDDVDDCRHLVKRLSTVVGNARRLERSMRISRSLQRSVMPLVPEHIEGADISCAYAPAERETDVGGDWYDVFTLPDGRFAISVGDVAGHGIDATSTMNVARHAIRTAALAASTPAEVLRLVDGMMQLDSAPPMVTAVYGVMHPAFRRFEFTVAGHPPPIVARADGAVEMLDCGGAPLGFGAPGTYVTTRVDLRVGDALVLHSDGMTEFTRDIEEGEQRLVEAIRAHLPRGGRDVARRIQESVFRSERPQDDAIVMVLRCNRRDDVSAQFVAMPRSCRAARVLLRDFLAENGIGAVMSGDIIVAAGEAVTNAIEHAYADREQRRFTIHVRANDRRVIVTVRDDGIWRRKNDGGRGRGIALMHGLMDEVRIDADDRGTAVRLVKERALVPV